MFQNCAYHEQHAFDPMTANHHYELLSSDFSSLYHKHNQQNGINIEFAPEYNLNNWLNLKHPEYKPALHQAVFYYCSRSAHNECLKVCISKKEMDMSAWKYGHKSQIILWCQSSKHHQLCIAKIGRPNLAFFLIPLTKVVLLVIRTNLSDGFLIGSKLGEL